MVQDVDHERRLLAGLPVGRRVQCAVRSRSHDHTGLRQGPAYTHAPCVATTNSELTRSSPSGLAAVIFICNFFTLYWLLDIFANDPGNIVNWINTLLISFLQGWLVQECAHASMPPPLQQPSRHSVTAAPLQREVERSVTMSDSTDSS